MLRTTCLVRRVPLIELYGKVGNHGGKNQGEEGGESEGQELRLTAYIALVIISAARTTSFMSRNVDKCPGYEENATYRERSLRATRSTNPYKYLYLYSFGLPSDALIRTIGVL